MITNNRHKSFLHYIFGDLYWEMKENIPTLYIYLYSIILGVLFLLSLVCEVGFISSLLLLLSGNSLLFAAYLSVIIVRFEKIIAVSGHFYLEDEQDKLAIKKQYNKTKYYTYVALLISILLIIFSNIYNNKYAFRCSTFYVETSESTYHINKKCSYIKNKPLEEMTGAEIESCQYELCVACDEWAEYSNDSYDFLRRK